MLLRNLLLVACTFLASCSGAGRPVIDDNPVPTAYRSAQIVVPTELVDEHAQMPQLWYEAASASGAFAIPHEVQRARIYWWVNELKAQVLEGKKDVDHSKIQVATRPGTQAEFTAAFDNVAASLGLTYEFRDVTNDTAYVVFDLGREAQWGELAWFVDQIYGLYPDLILLIDPYWEYAYAVPPAPIAPSGSPNPLSLAP